MAKQLSLIRLEYLYKGGQCAYQVHGLDIVPIIALIKTSSFVAGLQRLWLCWHPARFFSVQVTHAAEHTKKTELQEESI